MTHSIVGLIELAHSTIDLTQVGYALKAFDKWFGSRDLQDFRIIAAL